MRHLRLIIGALLIGGVILAPVGEAAATSQPVINHGLYLTPLRQYVTVNAGKSQSGVLTVANYTDNPITITLTAGRFSVTNYTYDYQFEPAGSEDWIRLGTSVLQLQPFKNQQISYAVNVPAGATPGGHYFTLTANTILGSGAVKSHVQAASILYVTVNGPLRYESAMRSSSLPWIAFGSTIPYQFDVANTGNTHFFVYTSGHLQGWSAAAPEPLVAHILLPGTTRAIGGSITSPILPGLYQAIYGYKTDTGTTVNRSGYVLYVPPWSLFLPLGVGIIIFSIVRHRRRRLY